MQLAEIWAWVGWASVIVVCPPIKLVLVPRGQTIKPFAHPTRLLAAGKEPGKYTEGVILSPAMKALFRSVPPAIALAMTEQHEKAERARIMKERHCSELDAALVVAERIAEGRLSLNAFF